ncbi:hypothetical protein [Natronorubrum daqingense]|uniref:Uncharacterized protein n=1 Tax=Natronorubrum daqingense TaxID=588898 RepID=A0A1N7F686_9EURY|nr:hypothetical protein [Natronorubrum daqingense]APX97559.1 hypothetical protein BB347_13600 [Natronorubrum daqingense]SIR95745.1 hypothetical protein SAMN05421809_3035 [Natronorubrum daqingense]
MGSLDAEIDETVRNDTGTYNFDAEPGDEIEIEIENEEGLSTMVLLEDPDDEQVLDEDVETEETFEHEAEMEGAYTIYVMPMEVASVTVWVDS